MSLFIQNNNGPVYHECTVTINNGQTTIENQQPTDERSQPEEVQAREFFCCITREAIEAGKAQQVENELRSATISAPKLVQCIRTNEALGYLDTKNLSSQALYDLLNDHFGLEYKYPNFAKYCRD